MTRRNQRAQNFEEMSRAWDRNALALHVIDSGEALRTWSGSPWGPLSANESNPNSVAPAAARIVMAEEQFGKIAIWPVMSAAAVMVLAVWARETGASLWKRVAVLNVDGTTSDVECIVNTGFRDTFVQAVSGIDGAHTLTMHVAGC